LKEKKFLSEKLLTQSVLKQYEFIETAEIYRAEHIKDYTTALAILPNINQLALLEKIDKKVKELNHEGNRFLLGDTQHLLSKMIGDSDAPFIYEKIGSRLKHIMIDEFQDTSTIQWKNFKVLLNDCLDNGKHSLVVGDVKQSIYRWRSGDWNLLNNILTEFPNKAHEHPLKVNFRSYENIIHFNNLFFTLAKEVEKCAFDEHYKQIIDSAYDNDSIKQEIKNKNGKGYVRIKLLAKESGDYDTLQMEEIHNAICELKNKGIAENKIVILLRANDKIAQIAKYFTSHYEDTKIISDEAFLLSSSPAVSIIINALKILSEHGMDEICLAQLVMQYLQCSKNADFQEDMLLDKDNLSALLPQEFTAKRKELTSTPLYDLVEELVRIFHLDRISGQAQYLCTFFDYLLDFVNHNPSGLKLFLKEWETNISKKSIQSEDVDGVRIMSIHKSKGLEFENVIIPYCDWQKERSNSLLWLKTEGKGQFSDLPLVPVNYTKTLAESHLSKEYQNEHLQNIIDNLNLLYVAFTRPKHNLFIISKSATGEASIAGLITKTVEMLAENMGSVTKRFEDSRQPEILFEFGSLETGNPSRALSDEEDANVFCQQEEMLTTTIHSNCANLQFRESNKSNIFANSQAAEDDEAVVLPDNRERGLLLHSLFSEIEYADDADDVLDRYDREGLFGNIVSLEEARQEIEKCLENSNMREWFSDNWKVLNEREILTNTIFGTKKYRCDRVVYNGEKTIVIDFKFGEPKTKYNKQVMSYIQQLKSIGFANVKGYLWYANEKRLEEVK
ncbi:MAG: 3'-5' exonuclease, partial [Prevotellaceae bacterium]|nr:3'-5' exonuclease [Prevotellaceae bacterium]